MLVEKPREIHLESVESWVDIYDNVKKHAEINGFMPAVFTVSRGDYASLNASWPGSLSKNLELTEEEVKTYSRRESPEHRNPACLVVKGVSVAMRE